MTCVEAEKSEKGGLGLEETELRLGLPGGNGKDGGDFTKKRGFSETIDLKLKLQTSKATNNSGSFEANNEAETLVEAGDPEKPSPPKAQVVGWPPVRSFRKNALLIQPGKDGKENGGENYGMTVVAMVKVSMDGAPYLRKVDLKLYKCYEELSTGLEKMFNSFTGGNRGSQGFDFMNERKLTDLLNGSEYVPTYEDKDGDWMLVGDVPWEMFVDSCKRLRIMKGSEASGLAPRAMEKCKSRICRLPIRSK